MNFEDLQDALKLEGAIERLDRAILDDQIQIENARREEQSARRHAAELETRLESRRQARDRIVGTLVAMYKARATK